MYIVPNYLSMLASKRKGTLSAKIHIPLSLKHLVEKNYFRPKIVSCKPRKPNPKKVNPSHTGPRSGKYVTEV